MPRTAAVPRYISIMRCPAHGFWAVAIEHQSGSGTRVTGSKCCGSWTTVQRWPIDRETLLEAYQGVEKYDAAWRAEQRAARVAEMRAQRTTVPSTPRSKAKRKKT